MNVKENVSTGAKEIKNTNEIRILKGIAISVILTCILLLIFSILLTYTEIKEETMGVVILIVSGLSILTGSSISMMHIAKNGMLYGTIVGASYVLILYLLSSLLGSGFSLNLMSILFIIIGMITGAIGGIVGVNRK